MRQIPLILLAAALCASEGEASSPPGGERRPPGFSPEEMFQKADADKDGKVTLAELTTALDARMKSEREGMFARIDANGDGQVSKEEFLAFEPPGQDGDGKKRRRGPDPAEMFKRHDRNGDGVITVDEVKRPDHREGHEGKPPKGQGKPPKGDEQPPH